MQVGAIQSLIQVFNQAFSQLGVVVDAKTVEGFAVVVYKSMTIQGRNYHNLEHVFSFVGPSDPIQTLAGIYHDIIYYQIDRGFLPEIWEIIRPFIREENGQFCLTKEIPPGEALVECVMSIFDLQPGMLLHPFSGLNEFLSALVANKQLEHLLSGKDLLKVTLCIEATIPFREKDYFYRLEARVVQTCRRFNLSFCGSELEDSLRLAVGFANKDVENFSDQDVGKFLETTWKLLPETNTALRSPDVYTIRQYRQARADTEAFLCALNPDNVFHSYRGNPPDEIFQLMIRRVRHNLATACEYLRLKLLAQAILESLAELTGGDVPQVFFMGDLPREGEHPQRLEDFLPGVEEAGWVDRRSDIYRLLETGPMGEADFDLKASPLSMYLYKSLGPKRCDQLLELAREMFAGFIQAQDFLAQLDYPVRQAIARASAAMVVTRREELLKYAA